MSVPFDVFDALIQPLRDADAREGRDFLYRYLRGQQHVWETTDQKIKSIPQLWSVTECPDEYLQYLKRIVGWTSQLDRITSQLSFDELRRLISISGRLWKLRGAESTVTDVIGYATGARCRTWSWFDFRWVLDETVLEEAHQGRDSWIIGTDEQQESNLRVVDDGTLNRDLVIELMKLLRATGERWEITYLAFLDLFLTDSDDTQWTKSVADSPSLLVQDGVLSLTETSQAESTWSIVGSAWAFYAAYFRLRGTSTAGPTGHGFYFHYSDSTNYYLVRCCPAEKKIYLWRRKGALTLLSTKDMAAEPYADGIWYGYRVTITPGGANGDLRINVFVDGAEIMSVQDTDPVYSGKVGVFHDSGETVECDEAEVLDLPAENDYVDINS